MKKSILTLMAVAAIATFFTTSCTKEDIQQQNYPSEVTPENWQQFKDAPAEVWAEVSAKYHAAHPAAKPSPSMAQGEKAICFNNFRCGRVSFWGGSFWQGLPGATITETQTGATRNTNGIGRFIMNGTNVTQWCVDYTNPNMTQQSGLTFDDIIAILDHTSNGNPFSFDNLTPESNAVRAYMAADADFNGTVNFDDAVLIWNVMNNNATFQETISVCDESQMELFTAQDPFGLTLLQSDCWSSSLDERRVVKIGDVDGSYDFQ